MTVLDAAEALSVILHELEEKGVELTKEQDEKWFQATIAIQKEYEKNRGVA